MLQEKLESLGLIRDLEAQGYSYETIFGSLSPELDKLYASYSWQKVPCGQDGIQPGYVIHAVPPEELLQDHPWEEWFVKFKEPHHHVLFQVKQSCCTTEILIPEDDQEHPQEVLGKYWYYYEDANSLPYMAQVEK